MISTNLWQLTSSMLKDISSRVKVETGDFLYYTVRLADGTIVCTIKKTYDDHDAAVMYQFRETSGYLYQTDDVIAKVASLGEQILNEALITEINKI